jgi:hypothetical protein
MGRVTAIAGLEPAKMIPDGRRKPTRNQYKVHIIVPQEIQVAWSAFRDLGGYTDSVLLRSIIHYGLLNPRQPSWLGRGWPFDGHVYRCTGWAENNAIGKSWPWFIETRISMGAKQALSMRARAMRVTLRGFVRGLVLDLLNGKIQAFHTVTEVSQMFVSERYHTLEGVLEDNALEQQRKARST